MDTLRMREKKFILSCKALDSLHRILRAGSHSSELGSLSTYNDVKSTPGIFQVVQFRDFSSWLDVTVLIRAVWGQALKRDIYRCPRSQGFPSLWSPEISK